MGGSNCAVVGCHHNKGKNPEFTFHALPHKPYEKERRERWIAAINRKNEDGTPWRPSKHTTVCGAHFVSGKPSTIAAHPDYVPSVFPGVSRKQSGEAERSLARFERAIKRRKINLGASTSSADTQTFLEVAGSLHIKVEPTTSCTVSTQVHFKLQDESFEFFSTLDGNNLQTQCNIVKVPNFVERSHVSCGTENDLQFCEGGFHGYKSVEQSESLLAILTSTSPQTFQHLLSYLPQNCFRRLKNEDSLLLFLMRMKLGLSFSCLGILFNVHRTSATRAFFAILEILEVACEK